MATVEFFDIMHKLFSNLGHQDMTRVLLVKIAKGEEKKMIRRHWKAIVIFLILVGIVGSGLINQVRREQNRPTPTPQVLTRVFTGSNETREARGIPTLPPADTPLPAETLAQLLIEGTFGPSQTPPPTWTLRPTHTVQPSNTPAPSRTPGPTWTPRPTWTRLPNEETQMYLGLNATLSAQNVPTRTPAPPPLSEPERVEANIARTMAWTWRITITPTPEPTATQTPAR